MRVIIQRVSQAAVSVDDQTLGQIQEGFMLLVGVHDDDTEETVDYMARKIAKMRIFADEEGKLNLDINQVGGKILSISQFTLYARTRKGNRPSFVDAAQPDHGEQIYLALNQKLREDYSLDVEEGQFGADMQVSLINDGPVTIILDSDE
ncbi:D-aminoacyl-tRNA deacylase [Aerococcus sp. UMB8608]|uniref:D-aminoacyl-tRNA deacylase n=1 Tax=Aerococcus sanguinicola TaxID=119206 RepID=A0A5N1GNI8_9LACT|nr:MULTISPECIES: D-aminoacyl-tRNA deacylase [Aerococcus]KAA9301829.1 D-tyrosyl-tRNA(Tyr) deacylase [Aerococcus sanguinicola]MDK6368750.1 D-aminoacyl-tRNA deacylase [Aerococcus sp. UMB9870]MDK6679298.1 D-aminoacyl-tRNA deacylase [Aerococcus sp. UMB8608]MDK6685860.1 D-aminoacyl-tRNA deacylase [Aerococcus sp. UMB8623]MDK6939373.1 D-aminoacyl-tRNA deacylase [Aerococcus sp. UMB8487]